jgi:methylated-DNA-[protein]-cysteine S-methyltransferase
MKEPSNTIYFTRMESPIGQLRLAGNESGLTRILFEHEGDEGSPDSPWIENANELQQPIEQLTEYFAGERHTFEIPLFPKGTPFQKSVWERLQRIAYGETTTYGELALQLGNPNASRAVGTANGQNPIPIIIPCHRVIGRDGSLTGYAGGLEIKEFLLDLERKHAQSGQGIFAF